MAGCRIGKSLDVEGEAVQDDSGEGVFGRFGNSTEVLVLGYRDRILGTRNVCLDTDLGPFVLAHHKDTDLPVLHLLDVRKLTGPFLCGRYPFLYPSLHAQASL